ncbi:MAG TPA: VOC family protein [Parvibaculum sp.]|uniref:VOC family protein n=1 Tax=Parvibaculum sp. TaxID=2024848 RepID=UPI002CEEAD1C|nr:VOC family protein [Parvibaculum sp.]HMM14089.1 VOC family protein [Parvibaculum sp.]
MVQVTELGYMGLGVKDLAQWKDFASKILGLEVADEGEPGRCYFRMDYWHHRFIVDEDGTDDLNYLGFRVAGTEEFRQMHRQLTEAGIKVRIGSPEEADERRVLEVMKLNDASGYPIEIFHGPQVQADKPFHPGRRMHGRFKTGDGGLGHLIQRETVGFEKTYEFYKLLGMRGGVEYKIALPGMPRPFELMFLHCNSRDHTLAFGPPGEKRINHLMIEVENFDDVGLAYEVVQQNGVPVAIAPGRHANDHMYSFYFVNPSGWMCEIGWGARAATHQSEYYQRDTYGHEPVLGVMKGVMEVAAE